MLWLCLPILPGYQVTHTDSDSDYYEYVISPIQKEAEHPIIEQKYAPTWTPENLEPYAVPMADGRMTSEDWMEDFPYHYNLFYFSPEAGQIRFSQFIPVYDQPYLSLEVRTGYSTRASGGEIEYVNKPLTFAPLTVSGRPGFLQVYHMDMYITNDNYK